MFLDLHACLGDSPMFKAQMESVEMYLHGLENQLRCACKAAKTSILAMNELAIANNQLARSLIDLGSLEVSSESVLGKNEGNDIICIGNQCALDWIRK